MSERAANLVLSAMVLAAVVVLAVLDKASSELVALAVGSVLPSPTAAAARKLTTRPPGG